MPGETINRLCASGLAAVVNASRMLAMGDSNIAIAGGVENMTRGPWVISKVSKAFGRDSQMYDSSFGWRFINPKLNEVYGTDGMGVTAENLVDIYGINREDQDAFAYRWHMLATAARDEEDFLKNSKRNYPKAQANDVIFRMTNLLNQNNS